MVTGGIEKMTGIVGAMENVAMKEITKGSKTGTETGTGRPLAFLCKLLQPIRVKQWPARD